MCERTPKRIFNQVGKIYARARVHRSPPPPVTIRARNIGFSVSLGLRARELPGAARTGLLPRPREISSSLLGV